MCQSISRSACLTAITSPTALLLKGVGEPPLMLALSTFFALRDAVSASAEHQVVVHMDAPATPERILLACERAKAARAH